MRKNSSEIKEGLWVSKRTRLLEDSRDEGARDSFNATEAGPGVIPSPPIYS